MNKYREQRKQETNLSTWDFVKFFQGLLGYHVYVFLAFNILVGMLDGIGLAMFIPLLEIATGTSGEESSLGNLEFLTNFFDNIGIPLNIISVLVFMMIIFTFKSIAAYLRDLYFIKLRLTSIKKIRFRLIKQLRSLSYVGYTKADPGAIQFAMIGETQRLVQGMTQFVRTVQSFVILLTYVFLAFVANWKFAILVAIGGVLSNFIYKFINQLTRREAKKLSSIGNRFNSYLIQSIQNFKYLKATNAFQKYEQNLRHAIYDFEQTQFRIGNLNAIALNIREPLIIMIISGVLLSHIFLLGGTFAGILVSLLLFYRALNYLVTMQNSWNVFLANSAALDAITELTDSFNEDSEGKQVKEPYGDVTELTVRNVHLTLNNNHILRGIDLNISPNESVAFVGESGAGKTTLAHILGGLIQPSTGNLLINNKELDSSMTNSFRNKVGYISQEPVIFDDTIYNNVTFWAEKSDENMSKFWDCIKLVHLEDMIANLPSKENSELGSQGVLVSGGQKQRISIARELFRDVDVLVMDEATSALDTETENIIKENIENLQGEYMMIIIAHRLSTIKNVDTIYLMKQGEIVNKGDFQELYAKSDTFRRMVDLQEV